MSIQIKDFGKTTAGQPVKVGILANDTIEVHILSYGATIQQLLVPDRKGNKVDVVLGYPTVQDYELNTCFPVSYTHLGSAVTTAECEGEPSPG